ncbi:mediator of RNA polymerase II transcription subunit 8-like [Tubulanus polymorphus]|uniref:mediator of RNA polymerase II transcription subunit 8-like n=1 Tax=Tubulanus polymorphus TaxID=672921 RepID=UPI003DA364C7
MQREEKQLEAALDALVQKLKDLKSALTSFLIKLEHEYESSNWPTMLDSFALITSQLNSLHKLLKSDRCPPLRNYILLPLVLNPDRDPELEKLSEGRVLTFDHALVPDYLRTKPEPEIEEKIHAYSNRAHILSVDNLQKQINGLNKVSNHMIDTIQSSRDDWESEISQKSAQPQTSSLTDTNALIAAVSFGKGLKQLRRSDSFTGMPDMTVRGPPQMMQQQQVPTPTINMNMNKAPSSVKTQIKAASSMNPYSR